MLAVAHEAIEREEVDERRFIGRRMVDETSLSDEAAARVYTAVWQNIAREDSNVSSRLGWAIGLTSGQFTAISFLVGGFANSHGQSSWPILIAVTIMAISILGMYFCYRTRVGVAAAHEQIKYLQEQYGTFAELFEQKLCLPRPFGQNKEQPGRRSSGVFPVALLSFWSIVFVASLGATIWTIAAAAVSSTDLKKVEMRPATRLEQPAAQPTVVNDQ